MIDEDEALIIERILTLLSDGLPRDPWKIPAEIDTTDYSPGEGSSPEVQHAATVAIMRGRVGRLAIIEKMVNELGFLTVTPEDPGDLVVINRRGSAWLRQRNKAPDEPEGS